MPCKGFRNGICPEECWDVGLRMMPAVIRTQRWLCEGTGEKWGSAYGFEGIKSWNSCPLRLACTVSLRTQSECWQKNSATLHLLAAVSHRATVRGVPKGSGQGSGAATTIRFSRLLKPNIAPISCFVPLFDLALRHQGGDRAGRGEHRCKEGPDPTDRQRNSAIVRSPMPPPVLRAKCAP